MTGRLHSASRQVEFCSDVGGDFLAGLRTVLTSTVYNHEW